MTSTNVNTRFSRLFQTISVPGDRLIRNKEGKKVVMPQNTPFKPLSWVIDNKPAPIMIAHTGKSGIIALDFDGEGGDQLFREALELDPNCKYISKGIGKPGGHMLYTDQDLTYLTQFIKNPNGINIDNLDVQMGNKLILLATPENTTKQLIRFEEPLTPMPKAVQLLIVNYYLSKIKPSVEKTTSNETHKDSKLYYIVRRALEHRGYNHTLFNIITPKKYKDIISVDPRYPDKPYHPDNLKEGAHIYLVSLATVLAQDPSINIELFTEVMGYINDLFSEPLDSKRLSSIITYITSGKSRIDGKPVWNYDPDWKKKGFIYTDHLGFSHEVFVFNNNGGTNYLDHNHITNQVETFTNATSLIDKIKTVTKNGNIKKEMILHRSRYVQLVEDPTLDFGLVEQETGYLFNGYIQSEELSILLNPDNHTDYKYPKTTIRFLENVIGNERTHRFFLPFIKRKFITREFSPLVLVLYGPPHSGKSAVPLGILGKFASNRLIKLTPEILTEKYNDWQINKDIAMVDEVHNTRSDHLKTIIQTINTISGSHLLTGIRAMHQTVSSTSYDNTITIVATTNRVVQLSTEPQDRRLVICRSRVKASEALGMTDDEIFDAIQRESKDFAYYLATEVKMLPKERYVTNDWLKDEDYKEFQEDSLPLSNSLTAAIDSGDFNRFARILEDLRIGDDDIVRSSLYIDKFKYVHVVLLNTDERDAMVPGLLRDADINSTELLKDLRVIRNTKVKIVDNKGKKRRNRKTVAIFDIHRLPPDLADTIERSRDIDEVAEAAVTGVSEIEGLDYD